MKDLQQLFHRPFTISNRDHQLKQALAAAGCNRPWLQQGLAAGALAAGAGLYIGRLSKVVELSLLSKIEAERIAHVLEQTTTLEARLRIISGYIEKV